MSNAYNEYYLSPEDLKTAEDNGIDKRRAHQRFYYLNWSKERAITEPVREIKLDEKDWAKLAERNGVSRNTYYKRRSYGWDAEKAATTPTMSRRESINSARKFIEPNYPAWVYENLDKYNISINTFHSRIHSYQWSLEDACTVLPGERNDNTNHEWRKDNEITFNKEI